MQTVLKNLEGFYIISIDHSESLFVYHKSRRSNDQEKTNDREKTKTLEEKIEQVKNFRPIDDTFFEVLADDIGVCQEMLRIILEDEKLIVKDVIVQSSERNLYGRSVRLDALCILGNGKKCNVEVQRSNKDHHLKRVRFNASVITVRDSQTDDKFEETIDLIVVYISEFDIFKRGRVIYHVDSVIRETQEKVDDGLERVFVNTAVKDGTTISEYMDCFLQKEIDNAKFPKLTNRVHYLKHEEGGVNAVCEIMKKYSDESRYTAGRGSRQRNRQRNRSTPGKHCRHQKHDHPLSGNEGSHSRRLHRIRIQHRHRRTPVRIQIAQDQNN